MDKGTITLNKYNFHDGTFAIGVSASGYLNTNTSAFRTFLNQCVGSPNMTLFKDEEIRDQRYAKGIQILLNGGYEVQEV